MERFSLNSLAIIQVLATAAVFADKTNNDNIDDYGNGAWCIPIEYIRGIHILLKYTYIVCNHSKDTVFN